MKKTSFTVSQKNAAARHGLSYGGPTLLTQLKSPEAEAEPPADELKYCPECLKSAEENQRAINQYNLQRTRLKLAPIELPASDMAHALLTPRCTGGLCAKHQSMQDLRIFRSNARQHTATLATSA